MFRMRLTVAGQCGTYIDCSSEHLIDKAEGEGLRGGRYEEKQRNTFSSKWGNAVFSVLIHPIG